MIIHVIVTIFVLIVAFLALYNFSFFSWHPICMSLCYGFLMVEAILVFSKHQAVIQCKTKLAKINLHGYTLLIALCLSLIGFVVIYINKIANGKDHFLTYHGCAGLLVVVYTTIQVPAGLLVKYANLLPLPRSITLQDLRLYHAMSGFSLFTMSCLTMIGGIWSNWTGRVSNVVTQCFLTAIVAFLIMFAIREVNNMLLKRRRGKKSSPAPQ